MKSLGVAETIPVRRSVVLAHQGGWDEVLLVVGPLVVVALLLFLANRRVSAQLDRVTSDADGEQITDPGRGEDQDRGEDTAEGEGHGPSAAETQPEGTEAADRDRGRKRDKPQR